MIQKYKSMDVENKSMTHFLLLIAFMIIVPIATGLLGFMLLSKIVLGVAIVLFFLVSTSEQRKLTAFYSQRAITEAADDISARLAKEKVDAEKKFAELWDDALDWMTAFDSYKWYSEKALTHFGCEGRDCGQFTDLCWKCSNSIDHMVISSSHAWIQGINKRAAIEKKYANAGSAYVGIPIPWKEGNESTKQLTR